MSEEIVPAATTPAPEQAAAPPPASGKTPLPPKSLLVAYILLILFSILGIHHFYLGKIGRGLLWLFTGGLLGVGVIIDIFTLPAQTRTVNARRAVGIR
jgi:hypothetical protein